MKAKKTIYKNASAFGRSLGLSKIDMELIRQKKLIIEKLRMERVKREISQTELAKRVDSRQPAIARMESGQVSEVSLDFLARVALALGLNIIKLAA